MPRYVIYMRSVDKFLWIEQDEWNEIQGQPDYVLIKIVWLALNREVEVVVNAMNREIVLLT